MSQPGLRGVILKVASRCNLDCVYCYVYNKGDSTWKRRSPLMSDETFDLALLRIREHCRASGQSSTSMTFHGGEPCLLSARRFDAWCGRARRALEDVAAVEFCIQTNGTLLDAEWAEVLARHGVRVGVSLDGPREANDRERVDHDGRGSYDAVVRGMTALRNANVPFGILTVIPLGADPLPTHRHLTSLGAESVTYLFPDFTHDTISPVRERYGATPCADFLVPVFDDWWYHSTLDVQIGDFWNMARVILGGSSEIGAIGNEPARYAVVETDGEIEGIDGLRICREEMAATGLNVRDAAFSDIVRLGGLHRQAIFEGMPLPRGCIACPERDTCAGGYLPHRYSAENAFDNPSVWCADLLRLFGHVRSRLNVDVEETDRRRERLRTLAAGKSSAAPRSAQAST